MMKKFKPFLILITIINLTVQSYSQSYIKTDTSEVFGVNIYEGLDQENAEFVKVSNGSNTTTYTAKDIIAYGLKSGKEYVAKPILIDGIEKKCFLEIIATGQTTFYYINDKGRRRFFIETTDKSFVEIDKNKASDSYYKKVLRTKFSEKTEIVNQLNEITFNKKSMGLMGTRLNQDIYLPIPRLRFGIKGGYHSFKLNPSNQTTYSYLLAMPDAYITSQMIGVFVDLPLSTIYSVEIGANIMQYKATNYESATKFAFIFESLQIPLVFKYSYPSNKIRPYIEAGNVLTYNINNTALLKGSYNIYGVFSGGGYESEIITSFQEGYAVGCGVEFKIWNKIGTIINFRYVNSFSLPQFQKLNTKEFQINIGFIF